VSQPRAVQTAAAAPPRSAMERLCDLMTLFFILQTIDALAIIDRLVYGTWDGKSGDKISQSLNLLQIGISLALFGLGLRKTRRIGTGGWLALLLPALFLLSTVWSVDPSTTLRRAVLYMFFILGCIGVANIYRAERFLELFALAGFLSVISSIILLIVSHDNAFLIDPSAEPSTAFSPDFRGIFAHKNVLGQVMAAGALAALHGIRASRKRRMLNIVMVCSFIGMTFASKSTTSLLTVLSFTSVTLSVLMLRLGGIGRILGMASFVVLAIAVTGAAVFPDALLEIVGKDPTLTGRTELWALVMDAIAQKPVTGWGFYAFWSSANPLSSEISQAVGWNVPQAHNGILEILLELGLVGAVAIVAFLVRTMVLGIRCIGTPANELGITALLSCGGILLVGATEMVVLDPSEPGATLLFVTAFMCEYALRSPQARRYSAPALSAAYPIGNRPGRML
jgi:O-antigen ligase